MTSSTKPLLYLASASPRRKELLDQIGVAHHVLLLPPVEGEDEPRQANETPLAYVQRIALDKALRAAHWLKQPAQKEQAARLPNGPILSADTTVALGDRIFGKPVDLEDAAAILTELSNKTHRVYTAMVLLTETGVYRGLSEALVTFKTLHSNEIAQYIETRDPLGKAGAYGIQGYAARFIKELQGSYSGVMGLPLYEVTELIREAKVLQ